MKVLIWPTLFLAGIGAVVALQFVGGDDRTCGEPTPATITPTPSVAPAPAFEARTMAGDIARFPDDYRGRFVLLNFWATWCLPCRAKVPDLVQSYDRFHERGFEILGVTLDGVRGITEQSVREFARDQRVPWKNVYADAVKIAMRYHVQGIPAAFLVDGDTGEVLAHGHDVYGPRLEEMLARKLRTNP